MSRAKPKIFFRGGFWRVTPMPRPYWRNRARWNAAHRFTGDYNDWIKTVRFATELLDRQRRRREIVLGTNYRYE